MTDITNKKIGIWGFGLVGKSALNYLTSLNNTCQILDNRTLTQKEIDLIQQKKATCVSQDHLNNFLYDNDHILASPGIDISNYTQKAHFICELDIFAHYWKKPIIAITGSVGKTTVTTLLGTIMSKKYNVVVGGNIGTPMFDLIKQQNNADIAILECSSWQLEYAQSFRPNIAIITNLHPNHLDRHRTMENYTNAKLNILRNQTKNDIAILPIQINDTIEKLNIASQTIWIDPNNINIAQTLPKSTFKQNWYIILAVLNQLDLPASLIDESNMHIEHRLELVKTINNISFYNDSKSTTPASTLAALQQFDTQHVILFLGGLSKGIDRSSFITQLPKNIKHVICFGKEAQQLSNMCSKQKLSTTAFNDLTSAFSFCTSLIEPNNIILFSPTGSSFDLYENYKKRGDHFKQMIASL